MCRPRIPSTIEDNPVGEAYVPIDLLGRYGKVIPDGTDADVSGVEVDPVPALSIWCCFLDAPTGKLWVGHAIIEGYRSPDDISFNELEVHRVSEKHRLNPKKIRDKITSQFLDSGMEILEGDFVIKPDQRRLVNRGRLVKSSRDSLPMSDSGMNGLGDDPSTHRADPRDEPSLVEGLKRLLSRLARARRSIIAPSWE